MARGLYLGTEHGVEVVYGLVDGVSLGAADASDEAAALLEAVATHYVVAGDPLSGLVLSRTATLLRDLVKVRRG